VVIIKKIKYKTILHYLFAFLIPVSIFLFAMYLMELYPFGDTSMRISDANIQYPAFFEGLKDGDLFTFKIGLGANFYTIWTTYLASPLSLLYFFFENYQFDTFFVILVLIKIGLIGLNMNILLNYKKDRNKYSLIFSTIYALSGFVSLYYWNYQFLDALYMLPLIMIGIDKLINDNKNIMYFITLTLMIIFHYYTAYMICIFSVIYFFFLLINSELESKEKKKRIIKFFVTSLFCGLCSSFITIPSIYSFLQGRAGVTNDINYLAFNKEVLSMFYNLTSGSSFPIDLQNFSAPVFITLFIVVLLTRIFFDKNIPKKYKLSVLGIIILYLFSLSFNFIYYGWHFFNQPQGLPGRFIFCFNAFFVLISYKEFVSNSNFKSSKMIGFTIILIVILILSFLYKINLYNLNLFNVDKRFIILLIFNILLILYYIFLGKNKKLFILTFFLIVLELLINLICSINVNFSLLNYETINVAKEKKITKNINFLLKEDKATTNTTNNFYRSEFLSSNYGMFFGVETVSYYSSIFNNNLIAFLGKDFNSFNNLNNNINYVVDYSQNYLLNGFLGIKDIYYLNENRVNILTNNYYINSLGFTIKDNYLLDEQITNDNIIDILNNLIDKKTLKLKTLYPKIYYENTSFENNKFKLLNSNKDGEVTLEFIIKENSLMDFNFDYEYILNKNNLKKYFFNELVDIYVNDEQVNNILYLNKGDNLKIVISIPSDLGEALLSSELNYVDLESYNEIINELNKNVITDLNFNKFGFNGKINVNSRKKMLVLTIPYDECIKIYIDGKECKYKKIFNGIIGVNLEEGDYKINLIYVVKGLNLGIIISSISFVFCLILKILEKKYNRSYNKNIIRRRFAK